MHMTFLERKGGVRKALCVRKEKKRREKKETERVQGFSESTLEFLPRVREVRR